MIQVFKKEFSGFLNSLIAYIVIGVFLVGIGLPMWVFPETSVLDYGFADLSTLFSVGPYLLMFLAPAITMRSFAEEKKTGTMEFLFTKPLTDLQIILGKYLASFALVIVSLLPTITYYFSVYFLGNPEGNLDTPGIIGSYLGLILLGGVFAALGILASSITPNQVVSFLVAAMLCFLFYSGFESLSQLPFWGNYGLAVKQVGIYYHFESMEKGLIDSRDLIYFLSISGLIIFLTKIGLAVRKW